MYTLRYYSFVLLYLVFIICSCNQIPQPINYGMDTCHYCQMTIVDRIYAAEIVSDKGKVYKFDAVECLINYHKDLDDTTGYQLFCNYFEDPESFVTVEEATFLISQNLPSPMGAYLTPFKTTIKAKEIQESKGGELYHWDSLLNLPQFSFE